MAKRKQKNKKKKYTEPERQNYKDRQDAYFENYNTELPKSMRPYAESERVKKIQADRAEFARIHFPKQDEHIGNVLSFSRNRKESYPKPNGFVDINHMIEKLSGFLDSRNNYYITCNTFKSGNNRKQSNLFSLNNLVVDIDTHQSHLSNDQIRLQEEAIRKLIRFIQSDLWFETGLPMPNSIVETGRGVQLWFAIDQIPARSFDWMYKLVAEHFNKKIREFIQNIHLPFELKLDSTASGSINGMCRLPGSYNTVAGKFGALHIVHEGRFLLPDFFETYLQSWEQYDAYVERQLHPEPEKKKKKRRKSVRYSESLVFRADKLLELLKYRVRHKTGETPRDLFLFCACACMTGFKKKDEIEEYLSRMNQVFPHPLPEHEWRSYMATCLRKGYWIRNTTIIEKLDISEEEQKMIGLLPAGFHKRPRGRKCSDKYNKIIQDYYAGMDVKEISEKYELSLGRVYQIFTKFGLLTGKEKEKYEIICLLRQGKSALWIIKHRDFKKRRVYEIAANLSKKLELLKKKFYRYQERRMEEAKRKEELKTVKYERARKRLEEQEARALFHEKNLRHDGRCEPIRGGRRRGKSQNPAIRGLESCCAFFDVFCPYIRSVPEDRADGRRTEALSEHSRSPFIVENAVTDQTPGRLSECHAHEFEFASMKSRFCSLSIRGIKLDTPVSP